MPYIKKRRYAKKRVYRKRKTASKVSKPLRRAIKAVTKSQVETKTINVPDAASLGLSNTIYRAYNHTQGIQILAADIFSVRKGVDDGSNLLATNRIGDKIQGVGFLMDYYFSSRSWYTLVNTYYIPFIKLRIVVFRQAQSTGALTQDLLLDTNFLQGNTSTLQPINWDEGFVKDVLYDRVHIIRNNQFQASGLQSAVPSAQLPFANVFHFKKYIKFDHPIKFFDNQTTSNATDKPVNVAIFAEMDDSNASLIPSGTNILYTTGYTRAWFKDA